MDAAFGSASFYIAQKRETLCQISAISDGYCQHMTKAAAHNKPEPNGGENSMASNSNGNRINVPQAKEALSNMKYEIARELGVNLKQGYNGDLTSREAGYVGGYMVKRLIESAEKQMAGQQTL